MPKIANTPKMLTMLAVSARRRSRNLIRSSGLPFGELRTALVAERTKTTHHDGGMCARLEEPTFTRLHKLVPPWAVAAAFAVVRWGVVVFTVAWVHRGLFACTRKRRCSLA